MFAADACRRDLESLHLQIKNVFDLSEFLLGMKNPFISSAPLSLSEVLQVFQAGCICLNTSFFFRLLKLFRILVTIPLLKEPPLFSRVFAQLEPPSAAARRRLK